MVFELCLNILIIKGINS